MTKTPQSFGAFECNWVKQVGAFIGEGMLIRSCFEAWLYYQCNEVPILMMQCFKLCQVLDREVSQKMAKFEELVKEVRLLLYYASSEYLENMLKSALQVQIWVRLFKTNNVVS